VGRHVYERDVRLVCDVQSQPVVNSVSVHWSDESSAASSHQRVVTVVRSNLTTAVAQRDGHLVLMLQHSNTSVRISINQFI